MTRARLTLALVCAAAACAGPAPTAPRVTVTIPPGATLDAAIDSLEAGRLIASPALFRLFALFQGLRHQLKSGVYVFPTGVRWSTLVRALKTGHGAEISWTVPEGLMLVEVADLAQQELGVPRDSFLLAARDPARLQELGIEGTAASVEGYLFPTTYLVPVHIGARELVRIMTHEFLSRWDPRWDARLDTLRMTRHQLVTLASIIQSEMRYEPDGPYISAVYHNRLERRMKLEADPTVIYAYGRRLRRVWDRTLEIRSPYNTYRHAGLPPGPISQPGRASLVAALYPAVVPFLFFVAQPNGKHVFSTTLAQHEAAIRAIRRAPHAARAPRPAGP